MNRWKDTSKEKDGSCWHVVSGMLDIVIVSKHVHNPGYWTLHCAELRMDTVSLELSSTEQSSLAKKLALELVRSRLRVLSQNLDAIEG